MKNATKNGIIEENINNIQQKCEGLINGNITQFKEYINQCSKVTLIEIIQYLTFQKFSDSMEQVSDIVMSYLKSDTYCVRGYVDSSDRVNVEIVYEGSLLECQRVCELLEQVFEFQDTDVDDLTPEQKLIVNELENMSVYMSIENIDGLTYYKNLGIWISQEVKE